MGDRVSEKDSCITNSDIESGKSIKEEKLQDQGKITRRGFIGSLGGAAFATGLLGITPILAGCNENAKGQGFDCTDIGPLDQSQRANKSFNLRVDAANNNLDMSDVQHVCNADENFFPNRIASYSKGLPHDQLGEVDQDAYDLMLTALETGKEEDFEKIPLSGDVKLKNPQGGLTFDLLGPDSHQEVMPPPPAFDSAEGAGEIAELYWMAILRDINFSSYNSNSLVEEAVNDLNRFSDFRGPKENGSVTPSTLFRADIPGVLKGPFLSQFHLKNIPSGPQILNHKIRTLLPVDYITNYSEWIDLQNGLLPANAISTDVFDPVFRYMRNGRDLAENHHWDWPAQEAFNAILIIFGLEGKSPQEVFLINSGVPWDQNNPYYNYSTQAGFVSFHIVDIYRMVAEVMDLSLKGAWFQKWFVHRRLRPEEFGGRIHNNLASNTQYPIHEDIFNSTVLDKIFNFYGSYLLPLAFPEGAPSHPSYPSGHATWAGATITVLKAFFDEDVVIPDPVLPSSDGLELVPYTGPESNDLKIGGELNKLAWNIAMGRNFSGLHWRTDASMGLALGEQIAISMLKELKKTYTESFQGYKLTLFDGTKITV